ncbi:hypothetical protein CC86DRAFT_112050 [Ophiobolus disseminans]|uniref:Secreted protein n=1 Tax=Ophiobolus disseminans TaxID=1469910 RepID=A0A6A6ZIS8_9PLEO|nr:hypothetical protein CC86DRAFT_112050 [Ophiobolus disseminans]
MWLVRIATLLYLTCLTAAIVNPPRVLARDLSPVNTSVQILYGQSNDGGYLWSVWYGPYGKAVNPCNAVPFLWSCDRVAAEVEPANRTTNLYAPPFPPNSTWNGFLPAWLGDECHLQGYEESSPMLQCGSSLGLDFKKDPQFDDRVMYCGIRNVTYHRCRM